MKHSKGFLLLALVSLVSSCGKNQNDGYEFEGIPIKMSVPLPLDESKFYEYDPPLLIQTKLEPVGDHLNRTPEELLQEVVSASESEESSIQFQLMHKFDFCIKE